MSLAHMRYPSTIGMTFGLAAGTKRLEIEIEADRYELVEGEAAESDDEVGARVTRGPKGMWRRVSLEHPTTKIEVIDDGHLARVPVADGLDLRVLLRPNKDGVISSTLVLQNTFPRPEKGGTDAVCWFRPVVRVRAFDGEFVDRRRSDYFTHLDKDEQSGELLYRQQRHLAIGHGVAVTWAEDDIVTEVATTFFPQHDLKLAKADRDDVPALGMDDLAKPGQFAPLHALVDSYESWIELKRGETSALGSDFVGTAESNLDDARIAADRMRRGIALLENDPQAERAFRVMNSVMRQQRLRQEMIRRGLDEPPEDVAAEWRPFQLAFVLINIQGLVDPSSPERDLADLLWFPTGGGKTEAYLGLIAFTLVLRRLREERGVESGAGVGVIMRYTLRLLTLQQFERAAGLICALENYRESADGTDLVAKAPFSVGLWVGQGATPNDLAKAAAALRKRRAGEDAGENGDPVQLLKCPWCGSDLNPDDYHIDKPADRMLVKCPNGDCRFRSGLPVHLIDSDVYAERPSLVIGTVDKFAMLAWNERSGRLFGAAGDATPDLIVQDELHLISGPLGTLVGLYETAIDRLSTDDESGARPKLVASTATIRRADEQVKAVFARESRQFPPPGLDATDSFFAVDAPAEEKGTRRYVGLLAPTTSHATLLVRTYAALLQGASDLDAPDEVKDAYWTLLGYFNSLRVLGAAYIQSIDDVRDRIKVVAKRNGRQMRETRDPGELTSRIKSSDIPRELGILQKSIPDPESPDIVLATNMISVGVDVDRLGLMVVMGQPQTTAEYIQSTSRVGRRHPGLVFALFNAQRSRDLSHYEGFTTYHRALYKQVEATGATPFAERALDRGLHGVLIILARHLTAGAASEKSVAVPIEMETLRTLARVISERAEQVSPEAVEQVEEALEELVLTWGRAVEDKDVVQYANWKGVSGIKSLMVPAGVLSTKPGGDDGLAAEFPPTEVSWATLTSLRNVDQESTLKIISPSKKAVTQHGDE
ncbi:helicase-related protein [Planctomonas psychrotolerans]|uniref:helicase-related protein n=1 Tax=Planctomonas psychrotolerans TaxID=2528712 RepID=UPI001D0D6B0A|nr:helicase-related protein [Planctomonas psychrotolerans]